MSTASNPRACGRARYSGAGLGLCLVVAATLAFGASPASAPGAGSRPNALIVKLRGDGPRAVDDCAQKTFAAGRSFRDVTADASTSLDDALRRAGARRLRALFRRPDGRSFSEQRRRLRDRIARRLLAGVSPPDLAHVYRVSLSGETSVEEARALLAADPHVEWVQRDHDNVVDQAAPAHEPIEGADDPFLYSSGSWGQAFDDLWGLWRIRAPQAWSISRGTGVVVAVVDTGLDYDHPDIADNVWVNPGEDLNGNGRVDDSDWNGIDDDQNGFVDDLRGFDFAGSVDADQDGRFDGPEDTSDPDPFDDVGHGTHVAGIIAAVAGNGIGIAGVAPEARVMAVKGFPAEGPGLDSDLWAGVLYAAMNGARVINTSWSCFPECPYNPLGEEIVRLVHAMDVVIVTSAGNRLTDVVYNSPENRRETITVSSSGEDDRPSASFTNLGWLVDLAAPGGDPSDDPSVRIARSNILSLRSSADLTAEYATVSPGYRRNAGTSMSTPFVAGTVALLRSAQPDLDYESIRRILRESAVDTGPTGHDRQMGAGRLDALAALEHPPLPDLVAAITGPRQGSSFRPGPGNAIEIEGTAAGSDLLHYELTYGLGNDPSEWLPIGSPSGEPVRNAVLGRWPLDDVGEGTYVVRLEVEGHSGARYQEFFIVSLERNESVLVSEEGRPAGAPSISGDLVVWESRRDASDPQLETDDFNLFASTFPDASEPSRSAGRSGRHPRPRHFLVSDAPGDQVQPSIAGRTISWMDWRNDLGRAEIFGCVLGRNGRNGCESFPVSDGETTSLPPASTPGWIFWIDARTGSNDIRSCRADERGCAASDTGLAPLVRSFLRSDGSSLVWSDPGLRIGTCRVDPVTGTCRSAGPADPIAAVSRATFSGSNLAWVAAVPRGNKRTLEICELDAATGSCPAIEVARDVGDPTPSLSGDRLVWDAALGDEASDVFYCEFDRVRQRCPVQRLTAHHAGQAGSAIDGRRVVWEDGRDGGTEIRGMLLPELAPLHDRRVFAGERLVIPVRQQVDGVGEAPLALAAESVDGPDLATLGARFRSLPGRRSRGSSSGGRATSRRDTTCSPSRGRPPPGW